MIPITKPVFDETDLTLIQEPLKSGWVVQGRYVAEFERLFADMTGSRYALATTSCTTALHIAMAALGIGPGDEVLVPAFTWISTANAVEYVGARPVFVDVELDTLNVDVAQLEERITPRTRAVVPVHLFGLCADMAPILEIAHRHGLFVIEDAACAFDAWYRGRHAGTFGEFGCFSFHPRKAITTGEGGMVTTQDDARMRLCASLRDHGATRSDFQRHGQRQSFLLSDYPYLGFNFRMTDIQGALGVAQMGKAARIMAARREVAARYDRLLADVPWLQPPFRHQDYVHGYQSYVCLFRPEEPSVDQCEVLSARRNELMSALEARGISTRQGTHAAAHTAFYAGKYGIAPGDFPNAYIAEHQTITLPLYAGMPAQETEQVVEALHTEFAAVA